MLFLNSALLGSLVASTSALSLGQASNGAIFSRRSIANESETGKGVEPLDVGVHVHIMASLGEMQISDEAVENQMKIINENFAQINISFHVESVERIIEPIWASGEDLDGLKWENNKGDASNLNLYIIEKFAKYNRTKSNYLSLAHVPRDPYGYKADGVVLSLPVVPLSPTWDAEGPYEGKEAVRVIAKWFGLPSVFRSACDSTFDKLDRPVVEDIPAAVGNRRRPGEKKKEAGCEVGRNSCPDQPGVDPIHNFLYGSAESCSSEFSPGQGERIRQLWRDFRVDQPVFGPDTEWLPVLEKITAEGKKPWYTERSFAAASRFCRPDRFGVTAVKEESRCGSFFWCTFVKGHEEQLDPDEPVFFSRCIMARADPEQES
ncbi:hypothetical protein CP533_4585 [Ophiocordyceps camponoti-saundersi (nom. inval.)]|nr:hypothetical protein CP533_4585 [Ophiocordyceps camponoti-saundersi (nom. inval.)]